VREYGRASVSGPFFADLRLSHPERSNSDTAFRSASPAQVQLLSQSRGGARMNNILETEALTKKMFGCRL
jgi:hypothetical protein